MRREGSPAAVLIVLAALAVPVYGVYYFVARVVSASDSVSRGPRPIRDKKPRPPINPDTVFTNPLTPASAPTVAVAAAPKPPPVPEAPPPPKPAKAPLIVSRDPTLSPSDRVRMMAPPPRVSSPPDHPRPPRIPRKPVSDDFHVEAIIEFNGLPSAIVNGESVRSGSRIGKVQVVGISGDKVKFEYGRGKSFSKSVGE